MTVGLLKFERECEMSVPAGLDDGKVFPDDRRDHLEHGRGGVDHLEPITSLDAEDEVAEIGLFDIAAWFDVADLGGTRARSGS